MRDTILNAMRAISAPTIMTAAMYQGNKLQASPRGDSDRFFDVGICESHAVAFAAGQTKTGLKPIVTIYSTFMQRSYDQIFQEVALQNLPVVMMDQGRSGKVNGRLTTACSISAICESSRTSRWLRPIATKSTRCSILHYNTTADSRATIRSVTRGASLESEPIELGHFQRTVKPAGEPMAILGLGTCSNLRLTLLSDWRRTDWNCGHRSSLMKPLDEGLLIKKVFKNVAL
ncbi:MAG: hypothetical protein U0892_05335 [Pirellulales bacterium]